MAINNPYVPGDPACYDLKWIVKQLKSQASVLSGLNETITKEVIKAVEKINPVVYSNANELINSEQAANTLAYIMGYNEAGDGGGNLYYITDDYNNIISAPFYITLAAANIWALPIIVTPYVTPEMFGAIGDGITNDSSAFIYAFAVSKTVIGDKAKTYVADIQFTESKSNLVDVNIKGTITFDSDLVFINIENCDIDASGKNYGIYADVSVTKLRIYNTHVHNATVDCIHLDKCWDSILIGIGATAAGNTNIWLKQFNNGVFIGTSYYSENAGIYILESAACTIDATIQECKKTGCILENVLGSKLRLYLEQNGYAGSTDEEQSQAVIGPSSRCVGNDITFYAIGGLGSDMESKYGLYLKYSDNNTFNGFADDHISDGFRCTSNSHGNIYNVVDKTHATITFDTSSSMPQLYEIMEVIGNTLITLDGAANMFYVPVINSTAAYMVSFKKTTSTTGVVRVTDNDGNNVADVPIALYKFSTGIRNA